jgi:hypothetical protein
MSIPMVLTIKKNNMVEITILKPKANPKANRKGDNIPFRAFRYK